MTDTFDILSTYLHLKDDGRAVLLPVDERFWEEVDKEVVGGRLVTKFRLSGPMGHWEAHPAGEELLLLLSGEATVVLELQEGERHVRLSAEAPAFLVPPGVWHRLDAHDTAEVLFVTPGDGTRHRPL